MNFPPVRPPLYAKTHTQLGKTPRNAPRLEPFDIWRQGMINLLCPILMNLNLPISQFH
jgi:hypothetical protein